MTKGDREKIALMLEARADKIEAARAPDKVQPTSRMLPTQSEMDEARYAARQLRVAADDVRAGLEE